MQNNLRLNPEIKPVNTMDDICLVAQLARSIWTEHYVPIIGREQVDYMLDKFQSPDAIWSDINERGFIYDLVMVNDNPAAYMASRPEKEKKSIFLSKLYVAKEYRNRGIASLLNNELVRRAHQNSINRIWLTVNRNNLGSIGAYERLGFKKAGQKIQEIGSGFVMDDYVMQLNIS